MRLPAAHFVPKKAGQTVQGDPGTRDSEGISLMPTQGSLALALLEDKDALVYSPKTQEGSKPV